MKHSNSSTTQVEDEAIQWLAKLNSPRLTQAEQDEFFTWVASSPRHQAAYIKAEELWQRGVVLAKLPKPVAKAWGFPSFSTRAWSNWAIACACLFMIGLGLLTNFSHNTSHYSYHTAIGEQQDIELEDGSLITLNTDSDIDLQFSRQARTAILKRGEVFFNVMSDKDRPFDIHTDFGVVRVVGTRFSVYRSASDAVVTVIEGRVALGVKSETTNGFESDMVLQANERSSLQSAQTSQAVERLDASAALAWRKKQLVFSNQPLTQVIGEINRYFPEVITLAEPNLGERQITAVIQLADVKTTVQALARSLDLHADFDGAGASIILLRDLKKAPPEK